MPGGKQEMSLPSWAHMLSEGGGEDPRDSHACVRDTGITGSYLMPQGEQNPGSSSSPGLQSRP